MKLNQFVVTALIAVMFISCKKNSTTPATSAELSKDSIFLYAKQIYLWNDAIPSYATFNPRKYTGTTDLASYNSELYAISQLKINGATGRPYEYTTNGSAKYSYISDITTQNPTASLTTEKSSVDLEGNGNDLGIRFGYYGTDASFITYVAAVYQNSPAEKAGILRGYRITKINGVAYGTNFSANINALSTAISANSVSIEGIKSDGTSFSTVLAKSVFKSSPIYKVKVITVGAKKVGYLAYARFSNEANSNAELDAAFNTFAAGGVTDLVIDLRFNGGGYVSTAQYLVNLIAPSTANGVMFTEHYNALMQSGGATILANQPLLDENDKVQYKNGKLVTYADIDYSTAENIEVFAKKGPLTNIKNVVFIVSEYTASASELVINSLKPHMTVQLVGLTTYGKPVGFFPVKIQNRYEVYFSLFETKNSLGQGGYYAGITPNISAPEVPANTMMYEFGDPNDNYLKKALELIAPGVSVTSGAKTTALAQQNLTSNSSEVISTDLGSKEFKGMIETRFKMKN